MKNKGLLSVAVSVLMLAIMACQVGTFLPTAAPAEVPAATSAATYASPVAVDLVNQQDKLIALFKSVSPAVTTIFTSNSLGSGWVYSSDGYIVTNQHVVGTETKVEVHFPSGTKVYGNVVGTDLNSDLAVIKVDLPADQLHPLALGNSDLLQVGQIAIAIGDPLALNGTTLTVGVVSGLGRSEESNAPTGSGYFAAGDFIQTDALLNHGNSGGPLLDINGQVIGVNRSIQLDPSTGLPSGLGYAISVNVVKRVVPQLIEKGRFDYPWIGASFFPNGLTLDVIELLDLKSTYGAYVTDITPGGPAEQAGLKAGTTATSNPNLSAGGDLIIAVDGRTVMEFNDLIRYVIVNKGPGDTVTLTVMRGDQKVDVPLTLGVRP